MVSLRTYNFILAVVLAALAVVAFGDSTPVILTGDFVEHRPEWEFGVLKGTFYYLYYDGEVDKCRLTFEYSLSYLNGGKIKNVYHYEDKARYSMNTDNCTGTTVQELLDPWWLNSDSSLSLYQPTSDLEDGKRWYERKEDKKSGSSQVFKILMNEGATAPADGYLGGIVFADGRSVKFSNVKVPDTIEPTSEVFSIIENCPRPTCPIYADIVFVLDSSGSVNYTEWQQMVEFVETIMNSFTFGPNAVEAAVVQFNGQDDGRNKVDIKNDPICGTKKRAGGDSKWPPPNCERCNKNGGELMATVKASAKNGEFDTVSPNRDELIRLLDATIRNDCAKGNGGCQAFDGNRGTCQALGLNLARKLLDNSPRRNYVNKPSSIVIVVTDGEDWYPNSTQRNATILREEYGAFLIEVGVGLTCQYDKDLLSSFASSLGSKNQTAYYDAADFNQILKIADELFRPLCEANFSSECGSSCNGFCGAGQCLCPDCEEPEDICHMTQCVVNSGGITVGCEIKETEYEVKDNICRKWKCDVTQNTPGVKRKGKWIPIDNKCEELRNQYPGECRRIYCDPQYPGGCRKDDNLNNTLCKAKAKTKCEHWECTNYSETPQDMESGCSTTNFTEQCVKELESDGRFVGVGGCFDVVCDGSSDKCTDMIVDTCKVNDTKCVVYSCEYVENNERYQCVPHETPHAANTSCTEWACDDASGWHIVIDRDENHCIDIAKMYNISKLTCTNFYCDPDAPFNETTTWSWLWGGCQADPRPGCDDMCSAENETFCLKSHEQNATHCVFDFCVIEDEKIGCAYTSYNYSDYSVEENCLDPENSAAIRAKELNEANTDPDKRVCYTPACNGVVGKCTYVEIPRPDDFILTRCMEPKCVRVSEDSGAWHWIYVPTKENTTCLSDACYSRVCNSTAGCVKEDICNIKTTECEQYTCSLVGDTFTCNYVNLTKDFLDLDCIKEVCEDGVKKTVYPTDPCPNNNKCLERYCEEGMCVTKNSTPPSNDACRDYTCDPEEGWTSTVKCDDGLACTTDECWNYGTFHECHNDPVDCSLEISMEGYGCFRPVCKENQTSNSYRCIRKLLANAYIDVCGNCIQDNPYEYDDEGGGDGDEDESVSVSYKRTSSDSKNLVTDCTNAPPRPLMVESLAAATIGLIIIGAVVAGAALTTSSVIGTKTLIARAKASKGLAAQSNPLFEGAETELTNPTYGV